MFVLPDALINLLWRLTDLSDVRRIIPDQLLQVLLSSERPIHVRDVFLLPTTHEMHEGAYQFHRSAALVPGLFRLKFIFQIL